MPTLPFGKGKTFCADADVVAVTARSEKSVTAMIRCCRPRSHCRRPTIIVFSFSTASMEHSRGLRRQPVEPILSPFPKAPAGALLRTWAIVVSEVYGTLAQGVPNSGRGGSGHGKFWKSRGFARP